jgi:hypothetical protein
MLVNIFIVSKVSPMCFDIFMSEVALQFVYVYTFINCNL